MEVENKLLNDEEMNQNSVVGPIRVNNKNVNQNSVIEQIRLNDEDVNQKSIVGPIRVNNQNMNRNSTVEPIRLDCELQFKLNSDIRDKLIAILNDYSSLFYGDKNKESVIEKANDLMYYFVDLPLKIDQINENVIDSIDKPLKIDQIKENVIDLIDYEPLKPTLIINSNVKTKITDLLIKNKNYFILFKDDKDVRSYLINENNSLVIKLMQFPIQMLKEDDPVDNDYVWKSVSNNEFNYKADDELIAKSNEQIANYKKELLELNENISILNDQLVAKLETDKELLELKQKIANSNALSKNKKESVTHFLEFKQFSYSFYRQESGEITTSPFECSDLDWFIKVKNLNNYFYFELVLIDRLSSNEKVRANCELILTNNKETSNTENMILNLSSVFIPNQIFKTKEKVEKDIVCDRFFGSDRLLSIQVNLTAELIDF